MPTPLATLATTSPGARPAAAAPPRPGARRHDLGTRLRELRQQRSLRLEDVAARLHIVPSTLSRIETGQAPVKTCYLTLMLDLYGVEDPGERARMTDLALDGQRKPWWAGAAQVLPEGAGPYLDLEAAAAGIAVHATRAIPGLSQTRPYAAAAARIIRPGLNDTETGLLAVIQAHRREQPRDGCQLHLIIDEAALARPVAAPDVMAAQYRQLHSLAAAPAFTVQVSTLASIPPALSGSFTVLTFPGAAEPLTCHQAPVGRVIITRRPADVRTTMDTFQTLAAAALSPADSADLIATLTSGPS